MSRAAPDTPAPTLPTPAAMLTPMGSRSPIWSASRRAASSRSSSRSATPDRVASLVLNSTSPALPGDRELPPPTAEFGRFVSTATSIGPTPSPSSSTSSATTQLAAERRAAVRRGAAATPVRHDVERARDCATVRTTTCCRKAKAVVGSRRRSPRRPWSSTDRRTRVSDRARRGAGAGSPSEAAAPGGSRPRDRAEPTGRRSPAQSSRTLPERQPGHPTARQSRTPCSGLGICT